MTEIQALGPPERYPCPECGKEFHSKLSLQGHMTSHRVPQPCPECGKNYKTAGALGNHRKREHGVESRSQREQRSPKVNHRDAFQVEDIFTAILRLLYPGGAVPISSVPALIEWREDTRRMLEKINA